MIKHLRPVDYMNVVADQMYNENNSQENCGTLLLGCYKGEFQPIPRWITFFFFLKDTAICAGKQSLLRKGAIAANLTFKIQRKILWFCMCKGWCHAFIIINPWLCELFPTQGNNFVWIYYLINT